MGQIDHQSDDAEVWLAVPSVDRFEASSHGRVRRLIIKKTGGLKVLVPGKPTFGTKKKVPVMVRYLINDTEGRSRHVSHLVCEAFHGPRPAGGFVCMHQDENALNNRPENLAWGTQSANLKAEAYSVWAKTRKPGERKLSEKDIAQMAVMLSFGAPQTKVAKRFGVSSAYVCNLVNGRGPASIVRAFAEARA